MGCTNCNTCEVSEKRGCGTSSVFNWLYQIESPTKENRNLLEVQFKGDRKDFFINKDNISLEVGDWIAVEAENTGHDIGKISMKGELVKLQMDRKKRDTTKNPLKKVYRKIEEQEFGKWQELIKKEDAILAQANRIIQDFKLEMKLSTIEFQGDSKKATFYYTADKRVDFRELIKEYSRKFKIKVEMRQIGVRQEAAKIGGIGSCGRELCCSTWMTEFPAVSTAAARYQQLSINPQKLSGQCGRLKCCLNFELDSYKEAIKDFPNIKTKLKLKKGTAKCVKIDVFQQKMYYYYLENPFDTIAVFTKDVKLIIEQNKKGVIPKDLEKHQIIDEENLLVFEDATGKDTITRFDTKKRNKSRKTKKK